MSQLNILHTPGTKDITYVYFKDIYLIEKNLRF